MVTTTFQNNMLENNFLVIDDAIPKHSQKELEMLVSDPSFKNWAYVYTSIYDEDVERYPDRITDDTIKAPQMVSVLYRDKHEASPILLEFIPVLTAIPFSIAQLIKVKINLTLPVAGATLTSYGIPHCDYPKMPQFLTAVYYINDSDGDTVIFNEPYGHRGGLTEKVRITPKQGRLVVFDGKLMHAGNYPTTNNPRFILNINFVPYQSF